jgi:hypothetical protein
MIPWKASYKDCTQKKNEKRKTKSNAREMAMGI